MAMDRTIEMSEAAKRPGKRPASSTSRSVTPFDSILSLHRTAGNQALQRLMRSGVLQAKLKVGQPNDVYEQEADRVADQVMRMAQPDRIQRVCSECEEELHRLPISAPAEIRRQAIEEEEEEVRLQPGATASTATPEVSGDLGARIDGLRGGGQPMPESAAAFFEPRFGHDFSQVRLHTDARAAETARELGALAYTVGHDVVFGEEQYAPESSAGKRLLAHELTHVIQQTGARPTGERAQRCPIAERVADPVVQRVWRLDRVSPAESVETNYSRGNGSVLSFPIGVDTGDTGALVGRANTWQETGFVHQQVGGRAQLAHWLTKHYIFKSDGTDRDFLQLRADGQFAGNAKAEDLEYARAGAVVWGRIIKRTAANPTPPDEELMTIKDGGISAATVGDLGVIEAEIPIGKGSATITIPLKKVDEGDFAPFSGSRNVLHDVPGTYTEVDVLLGVRIEADAEIETAFTGLAPWISRNWNTARANGLFKLQWESRTAPGAPPPPAPKTTDPGIAGKDQLSYPADCNRNTLIRAANKDGCSTVEGGNHTTVKKNDAVITQIPNTVKENNTCRSIIKILNKECLS